MKFYIGTAQEWTVHFNKIKQQAEIRLESAMKDYSCDCPACGMPIIVRDLKAVPVFVVIPEGFELKDIETTKSGVLVAAKPGKPGMVYSDRYERWCPIP